MEIKKRRPRVEEYLNRGTDGRDAFGIINITVLRAVAGYAVIKQRPLAISAERFMIGVSLNRERSSQGKLSGIKMGGWVNDTDT